MSFTSYAQNFEDVILNRVLKKVEFGFYIDVGAWSPQIDSVTRAFYEKGWSGINIEPNEKYFYELNIHRPRDKNICLSIGDTEGVSEMSFLSGFGSGMSTMLDEYAIKHIQSGWSLERKEVKLTTLNIIWQQFIPKDHAVHFLKIDVEGMEKSVISGNDWTKNRPWIVVVEATLPMTQIECHSEWEPYLIKADYQYVYADGLNRFYLASEKCILSEYFKYPPNIFDDFIHVSLVESKSREENLKQINNEIIAQIQNKS